MIGLVVGLVGCDGPADDKPPPHTDGTSDTADTGPPCAGAEVPLNGADDDCDGWADDLGEGFRSPSANQRVLTGTDGLLLGEAMDVGYAADGRVWLVAGGVSVMAEYGPFYGAVMALSQPGAELHHITSNDDFDAFGYAVVVGRFEGESGCHFLSEDERSASCYGGRESSSDDGVTEVPGAPRFAADVDQDGWDELIVGQTELSRASLVVLDGPVEVPLWNSERGRVVVEFSESPIPSNFGLRPGAAADLTGDGVFEMALPTSDEPGRQWIVPADVIGSATLQDLSFASLRGETVENTSTASPAVGDANGDGYADLLTGGALIGERRGKAYLVLGPFDGDHPLAEADAEFPGDFDNDICGWALTFVPDLDGDGTDEPVVACPRDRYFGTLAPGRVELFRGADARGTVRIGDAAAVWVEQLPGGFGWNVEGGFDLTDDGVPDLVVAAPFDSTAPEIGSATGAVYVLPGPLW